MCISENVGVFKVFSSTSPREKARGNEQVLLVNIWTCTIIRKTCRECGLGEFVYLRQCVSKSWEFAFLHISCVHFYSIPCCFHQRLPPVPLQQLHKWFLPPLLVQNLLLLMPCLLCFCFGIIDDFLLPTIWSCHTVLLILFQVTDFLISTWFLLLNCFLFCHVF